MFGSKKERWREGSILFHLVHPGGLGDRTVWSEVTWQRHKQHRRFSEKAKVGTGSQGTLPPASFTHTSNISSSPTWTLRAPPLLHTPVPSAPTSPSQSRLGDCFMQQRQQAPQPGKGSGSQLAREGGWKRSPLASLLRPTACGACLLQLSRDAFHPPHIHLWGCRVQERDSRVNRLRGVCGRVWHRSALAVRPRGVRALRARESAAAAATAGRARGAGCRCGQRPAGGAADAARC